MIIERIVVGPYSTNTYVVGDEASRQGIIIDPGDEVTNVMTRVNEAQLEIKRIVLTHGHIDHVGALKGIKEATGAEMSIHREDLGFVTGTGSRLISMLVSGLSYPRPPAPERMLADGDKITVDGLSFEIIHTPGHTRGGICLFGEGVLFSGDTLFAGSIGRTDLPGGSYDQLMGSIRSRLMALPDDTLVYPGHGPDTTIGDERRDNPFLTGK